MSVPAYSPLRFLLNGDPVTVAGVSPQTTLLEYLRDACRLTGTKEGCAEGDCGACTVVLAEHASGATDLGWKPVNACIRLLPSVDGKAVFTVESLKGDDGTLHPVQRALVECHGSQCGFCTPGFAMSLFGLYKNAHRPSRTAIDDALSGNLCRCTGYLPIVAAAQAMYDALPEIPVSDWRSPGFAAAGTRQTARADATLTAALVASARVGTLAYDAAGARWIAPRTVAELARVLLDEPSARLVAGATDLGLWITKQQRLLPTLVYVGDVAEMQVIGNTQTHLEIGAAATLTEAFAALEGEWPELSEAWTRFASVPIRNSATLGGNIANGSPIGDSMPVLMALGATVILRRGDEIRELAIEDLYLAYQQTALRPGEFLVMVRVPHRSPGLLLRAYKVSKRFDQDISAVFVCIAVALDGERIRMARIGCGGVAPTPVRARNTEGVLEGYAWDDTTVEAAASALADEFTPISDMRASASYRKAVLGNLLRRFRLETCDAGAITRIADVAPAAAD